MPSLYNYNPNSVSQWKVRQMFVTNNSCTEVKKCNGRKCTHVWRGRVNSIRRDRIF